MFFWFSGQYLGTGLGGDPHASTLGGSIDLAMEVANRIAVSANVPGALTRIQGQTQENIWGIGGPLETRVRVRLGPASPAFYSIEARPRWSSVVEARAQFLIPGFAGDTKYVGRIQRGFVQPAVYGAGELNVWRFQFAPGTGILVGDREAHLDLSLRVSVQLLDRLFGDVEVLRRQALAVPAEPGRCQSAWVGAAGLRVQFRRGVFLSARYAGGQGDCVPSQSFMLNLGLAFGEGLMRIPTADEVGFIRRWHALLMGMIDPVLDCQGIMRADDGTPMFRFGYPDPRDASIIRRNNVAYHVGEHFWEKNGYLYRDTDLSSPVLDLHGESPLTFAERAAMRSCPTLPGLGSPCQVALNLPALRRRIEQGDRPAQVVLAEDAQIVACLNHLSPLKAAAVFSSIEAALGPLLAKLPQVARWVDPAAPVRPPVREAIPVGPSAVAAAPSHGATPQPGEAPKVAMPTQSTAPHHGQNHRSRGTRGRTDKPSDSSGSATQVPHLPSLPEWPGRESSDVTADNTPDVPASAQRPKPGQVATQQPPGTKPGGERSALATVTHDEVPSHAANQVSRPNLPQKGPAATRTARPAEPVATASVRSGQPDNQTPDNSAPLCGTKCQLTLGAGAVVTTGAVAAGGELTKDVIVGGIAAGGESALVAGVTTVGGAVVGKIALDGIADHAMPAAGPTDPASPAVSDKPATPPADNHSRGERPEQSNQLKPKRGKIEGDLTQLQKEAFEHNHLGSQEELSAIDYYAERGHTVEKLPESKVPGQTTPDLLVDGELKEIKARAEPLQEDWVKYRVRDANRQFSKSGRGDNPTGSVDLRLKNQGQTDAEVLEQARAQVEREFRPDQYRSVTAVRVFNEGRLIGEWVRQGGKVVRVPSVSP